MIFRNILGAAVLAGAAISSPASAAVAIYTLTGTASGSIGSNSFSNAAFTFKSVADTAGAIPCAVGSTVVPGCTLVLNKSANISIDGLGGYDITDINVGYYATAANAFGVNYFNGNIGGLFGFSPSGGFGSWNLSSPLGPTPGVVVNFIVDPNTGPVMTSGGPLSFLFSTAPGTFQVSISDVPEPATWAMMVLGLGAVGAAMRGRKRVRIAYA